MVLKSEFIENSFHSDLSDLFETTRQELINEIKILVSTMYITH